MVLELYNLVTNNKKNVDKKYLEKFFYDNRDKPGLFLVKKEVENKLPEYLFVSTKGAESFKLSLVEAEITKKYINKQFGHDDENTVRNRVSSNLKNVSKNTMV